MLGFSAHYKPVSLIFHERLFECSVCQFELHKLLSKLFIYICQQTQLLSKKVSKFCCQRSDFLVGIVLQETSKAFTAGKWIFIPSNFSCYEKMECLRVYLILLLILFCLSGWAFEQRLRVDREEHVQEGDEPAVLRRAQGGAEHRRSRTTRRNFRAKRKVQNSADG